MSLESILNNLKPNVDDDFLNVIVPIVMSSVNKPKDIQLWYKIILDRLHDTDSALQVTLKLKEALFKNFVIIGYPKTINALQQLSLVIPDSIKTLLPDKPLRQEESWSDIQHQRQRGKDLFNTIYERHKDKVYNNMYNAYPDLAQTALYHMYGPILGESSILSAKETSLITCAALIIQDLPLQLIGHCHGALHNGATKQDLDRVHSIVASLADYYQCPIADNPMLNKK